MRYVLAPALAASFALCAVPADARDARYRIDIGAVYVTDAIATLSAQTGVSFAFDHPVPRRAVSAVRGSMTVGDALDRMFRTLDLRADRVGARVYRISTRNGVGKPVAAPISPSSPVDDIVVTGRKQSEMLSSVAGPVAVFVPDRDNRAASGATTRDIARVTEGFTLTGNGPGRDRLFIRGVADSAFNGFSQSTVSIQLDDTRLTYSAPEPGLRLVDIARVELLKGPQGPLYGTGALGGVYRIVTNRPVLGLVEGEGAIGVSTVADGGVGGQAEGMINLPLIRDRAAVRIVGYVASDPGWIDDAKFGRDLNRSITRGARVALRVLPFDGWTVDLTGTIQTIDARDSQYVYDVSDTRSRDIPIREPRFDKIVIAQNTITGSIGSLPLTIATGLTRQQQFENYDLSGSPAIPSPVQPRTYFDGRNDLVFDQEIRVGSSPGSRFVWVSGASFTLSRTDSYSTLLSGNGPMPGELIGHRRVIETAIFADGSIPLFRRMRMSLGFRAFETDTQDDRLPPEYLEARAKKSLSVTPSASLSYEVAPDQLIYARFGSAFRPGGLDPGNALNRRYVADEVRSIDLGARFRLDEGRLAIEADLFGTNWKNIQSDYLDANGLIATRNAGRARIVGAELSADWRLAGGWRFQAGAILQRPRLTHDMDDRALPRDQHLPIVPDVSARFAVSREMTLGEWRVAPGLAANFVGPSRLSFETDLDRRTPSYVIGRLGVSAERDRLTYRLAIDNLLDSRADTFAFGNPFSVRTNRQYTPLRPRTVSLTASRRF